MSCKNKKQQFRIPLPHGEITDYNSFHAARIFAARKEFFMTSSKTKDRVLFVSLFAILLAAEIVLSRFLTIYITPNIKISLAFIPLAIACRRNIVGGVAVAALGDLIGSMLFPVGPYFYGFTITAAVNAVIYSLVLQGNIKGKKGFAKASLAATIQQIIGGVLLNTVWLCSLYGSPVKVVFVSRLILAAIMIPIQILLIPPVLRIVDKTIASYSRQKSEE